MAVDPQTMLLMTNGIAMVAAAFLLLEWRALHERFLLSFAFGFVMIMIGCALAPLRQAGSFVIGIWLSNSMLPLAHLWFLHGAACFAGRRLHAGWHALPLLCALLMAAPDTVFRDQFIALFNSGFVALLSIRSAAILMTAQRTDGSDVRMLVATFVAHGAFYAVKTLCAFAPGAVVDLARFSGAMIPLSLFEGVLVTVALAMSVASALRRRREDVAIRLAQSDPLTGLLNRRGFESRANALLEKPNREGHGALLLIDVDYFKSINDGFGHPEGDRILQLLSRFLETRAPAGAIVGRVGGDEFAVVLPRSESRGGLDFAEGLCGDLALRRPDGGRITLSIGCAAFGATPTKLADLHLRADRSLYEAKRRGRDRACLAGRTSAAEGVRAPHLFPLTALG